ncbi:MAG: GTPase RsgA [Gemmatimonadetes bacterium]|nr:GTPase RsgA [Gemmatimonadota bacterium]
MAASSSTLVFLGPSGAGKSTLVNRLAGAALMRTGVVADDGRGKHTTTHRALITLPDDVTVIDTPGAARGGDVGGECGKRTPLCRHHDAGGGLSLWRLHARPGAGVRRAVGARERDTRRRPLRPVAPAAT